jgi:AcrR family transcriptional regulator
MSHIRKERSDVRRHKDALLQGAARVFAEKGVHASLDTVVQASGVSRATLYRHFPDRTALLRALFDREIAPLLKAGADLPRGEVLTAMIRKLGEITRTNVALADAWRAVADENAEMHRRQQNLIASFERPLRDAIEAGVIRADLTLDDVVTIVRMVAAANRQERPAGSDGERVMDLVLHGLRKCDS